MKILIKKDDYNKVIKEQTEKLASDLFLGFAKNTWPDYKKALQEVSDSLNLGFRGTNVSLYDMLTKNPKLSYLLTQLKGGGLDPAHLKQIETVKKQAQKFDELAQKMRVILNEIIKSGDEFAQYHEKFDVLVVPQHLAREIKDYNKIPKELKGKLKGRRVTDLDSPLKGELWFRKIDGKWKLYRQDIDSSG